MRNKIENMQIKLDLIQSWIKTTTEQFDDWEWDGKYLTIWFKDIIIEKYSRKDLKETILGF